MTAKPVPQEFPPLDVLAAEASNRYEREFIEIEFKPGLAYYLARLDRIGFRGGLAVDAGCGVGQWSLALSRRFERVAAFDIAHGRLVTLRRLAASMGAENLSAGVGSVEGLPLPDESADAVFCYGVIMFTDVAKSLREFHRVLKPGGRVYLCLNADGWNQYLVEERGRSDDNVRKAGQGVLYNTYWARAIARGLVPALRNNYRHIASRPMLHRAFRIASVRLKQAWMRRNLAKLLLSLHQPGRDLSRAVTDRLGGEFVTRLHDDVWSVLQGHDVPPTVSSTRSWQPDEIEPLATAAGFVDMQWDLEGGLVTDWLAPKPEPRYAGTFKDERAVWECVLQKPAAETPSVERHREAARRARREPVFVEPSPSPVVTNAARVTYPPHLLEHAAWTGRRYGGDRYLDGLARTIVEGAKDADEAAARLVTFVQGALFRDPVAQPLTPDGGIPEPLAILFAARGRCGHASRLLADLAKRAGLDARVTQLPRHVVAEIRGKDRWLLADADAFKCGVMPRNDAGALASLDDVHATPTLLDRVPAIGWMARPGTRWVTGQRGTAASGYVDALDPDVRGFVSGHYADAATGHPPTLPVVRRFERDGGTASLEWSPSTVRAGRVTGYRVAVGTRSRGWSWTDPGDGDAILTALPSDVFAGETAKTSIAFDAPAGALFASVTAVSDRLDRDSRTWFWPSEEATA